METIIELPRALGAIGSIGTLIDGKIKDYSKNVYYLEIGAFVARLIKKVEFDPKIDHESYDGILRKRIISTLGYVREEEVRNLTIINNTSETAKLVYDYVHLKNEAARNIVELQYMLKIALEK